jgi:hypothetical protein
MLMPFGHGILIAAYRTRFITQQKGGGGERVVKNKTESTDAFLK